MKLTAKSLSRGLPLSELKRDALRLADDLQTESRRPRPTTSFKRRAVTTSLIAIVAASLFLSTASAHAATEVTSPTTLTPQQQQSLLTEANERYNLALDTAANDSAEAKQAFADAAEKYQLLADTGLHNSRLFFNLASAYLESGDTPRAIANYQRSLRLDPTNRDARTNLAYAENLLSKPAAATDSNHAAKSLSNYVTIANDWLNQFVRPRTVLAAAILAWLTFWTAIAARLLALRATWKSLATAALLVTAIAATSYSLSCQSLNESHRDHHRAHRHAPHRRRRKLRHHHRQRRPRRPTGRARQTPRQLDPSPRR